MDATGRQFALQTFRFRWSTRAGTVFQDLFADVMENAWPVDFQRVKPYGRKCGQRHLRPELGKSGSVGAAGW